MVKLTKAPRYFVIIVSEKLSVIIYYAFSLTEMLATSLLLLHICTTNLATSNCFMELLT